MHQKIRNNKLNNEDIAELETIIFMRSEKSVVELLWEIAFLINKIENISEDVINDLKMFLEMYIKKFVEDKNEAERLMELVEMKKDLFHSTADTFIIRGEAKVIKAMLDNGFSLDEICNMTSFDKNYLLEILH